MKIDMTDRDPQDFEFTARTKMIYGVGTAKRLPRYLEDMSFSRIGFVVDGNLFSGMEYVREIVEECKKKFKVVILEEYRQKFEPTYQYLDSVKMKFKKGASPLVDCMVGIGGGSVMDSAKGIAILSTNHGAAIQYRGFPTDLERPLPMIAMPSTAGTGSEVAFNASFIDSDTQTKMGINTTLGYPVLAILDPVLVSKAPWPVAMSSGVDAFVHAFESFVSRKASPLNRIFARESVNLSYSSLPLLKERGDDLELWGKMQLAAYLAMIALSNSSSGPAASLSYLLGTHFNVPHGVAGGAFIAKVARLNHKLGYHGYSALFDTFGGKDGGQISELEKSEYVVSAVEQFLDKVGIPSRLSSFGVTAGDFPLFADFAAKSLKGALDLNPAEISRDDLMSFLKQIVEE